MAVVYLDFLPLTSDTDVRVYVLLPVSFVPHTYCMAVVHLLLPVYTYFLYRMVEPLSTMLLVGGHIKVCRILVEHGKCDLNIVDNSRQTAIQLAGIGRHKDVVAYLASFDPTKGLCT